MQELTAPGQSASLKFATMIVLLLSIFLGSSSNGSAQVVVPPDCLEVICPPDVVTNYTCGDVVAFQPPITVSNNCPGLNVQVVCNPPVGAPLPVGVHNVQCAVGSGGQIFARCEFRVVVIRDTERPEIRCPDDITVFACPDAAGGCSRVVNYPPPFATDNSGSVSVTCLPPSGSTFNCGTTLVTCRAFDRCQNMSECQFKITVNPAPPAQITCPTGPIQLTVPCGTNCVPAAYPAPTVVNGTLIGCSPAPGTCLPVGQHVVTCRAMNQCQQVVGCEFTIEVRPGQGEPPVIRCPQDITVTTCITNCQSVTYAPPVVVNGTLVACTPPSGTCFPVGVNTINCIARNECGTSECSFTVTVRPLPPATITCPAGPIQLTVPCGTNCVPAAYPAPVVSGIFLGCQPPQGTCLPVGVHVVTCRAMNQCQQIVSCEFTIEVRPGQDEPPVIRCPEDITVVTCSNDCQVVTYPPPTVINGALVGCLPPSGSCFPIGVNTVNCIARNQCGESECKFTVTVRPVPPAVIECPTQPQIFTLPCHTNCVPVNYTAPVVVNGALVGCQPPPGTCLPVGQHVVTCRATNICREVVGCEFVVIVRPGDIEPPSIRCPDDILVHTCNLNCQSVTYSPPVASPGATVVCAPPSGSCFPLGVTIVNCVARNDCGEAECKFTITVREGRPCVTPPHGMVLWLPFDEAAGPVANNIVAGAPNGVHANGPAPVLGQHVLNSLSFDGANDLVRVPHYAAIGLGASDMTIDAWVLRRDTGGRRAIVSKVRTLPTGGVRGYEFYLDNGVLKLDLAGVAFASFSSGVIVPADNQWHHVAVTVKRTGVHEVRFYLNGAAVSFSPGPVPALTGNSNPLYVGTSGLGGGGTIANWRGAIDEVEIFNRVLTLSEINGLWEAGPAGKCKIKCIIPWDVSFPFGAPCVTVTATLCNNTPFPQVLNWTASGPMPIPTPAGTVVLPPFACTNIPVTLCRPTNGVPVGSVVIWNFTVYSGTLCPMVCRGSVINPGPIVITVPTNIVVIPGTNITRQVRIGLNGLPPGQPVRLRSIGPDMEPDLDILSLNGLPPGQPVFRMGGEDVIDLGIRFTQIQPIGLYTILVELDVDGDGDFEVPASFDVQNRIVGPPTIRIVPRDGRYFLFWEDLGDGLGLLETSKEPDGPWEIIPNAGPGYPVDTSEEKRFFRVVVP